MTRDEWNEACDLASEFVKVLNGFFRTGDHLPFDKAQVVMTACQILERELRSNFEKEMGN